ncbi:MAG: hypothetical protein JXB38_22865 [Anaerolineales bacterium]|nr:hypothetical protein [Anaerolineales bacterium]
MDVQKNFLKSFILAFGLICILVAIVDRVLISASYFLVGMKKTFQVSHPIPISLQLRDLFLLVVGCGCILIIKDRKVVAAKLIYFIRHRTTYILLWIVSLILVNLFFITSPVLIYLFPIFIYFKVVNSIQLSAIVAVLLIVPLILVARYRLIYRNIYPICIAFSVFLFPYTSWIESSAVLGEDYYYLVGSAFELTSYDLYKCNSWGLKCQYLYSKSVGGQVDHVITSAEMQEVYLFEYMDLLFVDGQARVDSYKQFILCDMEDFGDELYIVNALEVEGKIRFLLHRWHRETLSSEVLPFIYYKDEIDEPWLTMMEDRSSFETYRELLDLVVDEENHELNIFVDDELIYTYGDNPRCHVEGCVIPGN